jgi:hypothetical protein
VSTTSLCSPRSGTPEVARHGARGRVHIVTRHIPKIGSTETTGQEELSQMPPLERDEDAHGPDWLEVALRQRDDEAAAKI